MPEVQSHSTCFAFYQRGISQQSGGGCCPVQLKGQISFPLEVCNSSQERISWRERIRLSCFCYFLWLANRYCLVFCPRTAFWPCTGLHASGGWCKSVQKQQPLPKCANLTSLITSDLKAWLSLGKLTVYCNTLSLAERRKFLNVGGGFCSFVKY